MNAVEKKVSTSSVIRCPYCGKRYFFEDIFIPDAVHHDNECFEQFICDDTIDAVGNVVERGCGNAFDVKVTVTYQVSKAVHPNFFEEETVIQPKEVAAQKLILSFDG